MKRKLISLAVVLVMLVSFIPLVAQAETGMQYGDYLYYKMNADGTGVTITDCDRNATGEIVIPDEIDNLPVTSIGDHAFMSCGALEEITIPDNVTSIGYGVFDLCNNLEKVNLPRNLTRINGFGSCPQLKNIFIPDGVEFIGKHAFSGTACYDDINNWTDGAFYIGNYLLDSDKENMGSECKIRNGTKYITSNAFYGCEQLTNVYMPDSLVSINDNAFAYCKNLKSVDIPDGVTYIGPNAFRNCEGLTNVNIPSSVVSIDAYAFYYCSNLVSVNIPSGVVSIGDGVFTSCHNLTSITIPDTVENIGYGAFEAYSGKLNIKVSDDNQYFCDVDGVLFDKNKTTILAYAKDLIQSDYTVPDSVNYIGNGTFSGCRNLTNIIIPDSVKSIGNSAFYLCGALTDIKIPNSVTYIGDSAFQSCTGLTNIIIPNGITSIGEYTFFRCFLKSLTIPDSVTSIADYAFERSSVRDLYYSGSISEWKSIKIGDNNASILNATIHYNAVGTAAPKIAGMPTVSGPQITIHLADVEYDSDLFAVFSGESGMIDFERIGISAGDTEKSAAIPSGAKTVRVFIWNSFNGMKPLCEAAEVTIP